MNLSIGVVVKTPAEGDTGNLALDMDIYQVTEGPDESNGYMGKAERINPMIALGLRSRVFEVGEILLLDEDGREPGFPGRKPDKWAVEVTMVDTLEEAASLAQEVMQQANAY